MDQYAEKKEYDAGGIEVTGVDSHPKTANYDEPYTGEEVQRVGTLHRQLKSRHIAMISIGGVIGTGLFLGTASALANGGPLGLLLGYLIVGSICYCVMISLGEMVAFLPIAGGHIMLADRFVDPAFAFTLGWNYWYNWLLILPAELSAAAVLINYWNTTINNGVWITICFVVVLAINFMGAGVYGECEFWFASIKVLTITGLILLGIIITSGGGPDHTSHGFEYWRNPGALNDTYGGFTGSKAKFLGFWAVMTQAAFSYIGTEIVAIAAGEAKNPRKNLPKAIKRVYIRILLFYIGGVFIIGLLVPYNYPNLKVHSNAAGSPFVIAISRAGIKVLPSIINACLLTSAWSAGSSDLYTSSRALYGLAITHRAPKIFAKTTKSGLPWVSVLFSGSFGCLAYMSLGSSSAADVFGYFADLTSSCGLLTWWGICFLYIRFNAGLKAQGIAKESLPYYTWLNKSSAAAWYAITLITIILFFCGWTSLAPGDTTRAADFLTNYLPQILFPVLWVGYKFIKKTKFVSASDMDFVSGLAEVEADTYDEPKPTTLIGKFWAALM